MVEATVQIAHAAGLHARPLALFVKLAKSFAADIEVSNLTTGHGPVNGKSPVHLLLLKAGQGHALRISAKGPQADQAVAALVALVKADFGQEATHG